MSCDVAVAAFLMFASTGDAPPPQPVPAVAAASSSVASEAFFQDIVLRASGLKADVELYAKDVGASPDAVPLKAFDAFSARIGELSALDQKGHELLKARGTDGDLKCILHGISQDLPLKLAAVREAKTGHDQALALRDLSFLLRDNVEVITAPPTPPV